MPEQVCYRGFCVEEGADVDPVSGVGDDAGMSVLPAPDAAPLRDASGKPETPVSDAGVKDAARDAGAQNAGANDAGANDAAPADAGNPCIQVCKAPIQGDKCKKCVEDTFGADPDELCGKGDKESPKQPPTNPFCIELCLSGASKKSSCTWLPFCVGSKCGGKP